jgi:hypothetical protein
LLLSPLHNLVFFLTIKTRINNNSKLISLLCHWMHFKLCGMLSYW